jgi:hypothetical protein
MAFLISEANQKEQKMLLGKKLKQLEGPPRALCPRGACIPRIPDNHNVSPPRNGLLGTSGRSG